MGIFKRSPKVAATGAFAESERALVQEIDNFQKKIISLTQKIALIEEHSNEYFQVLYEKGWNRVTERAERLEEVNREIDLCIKERRLDDALLIVRFVAQGVNPEDADDRQQVVSRFGELACWENETDKLILDVVIELGNAAEKTKTLGINRAHKRQATLTAVQELRRIIAGRKEKKAPLEEW